MKTSEAGSIRIAADLCVPSILERPDSEAKSGSQRKSQRPSNERKGPSMKVPTGDGTPSDDACAGREHVPGWHQHSLPLAHTFCLVPLQSKKGALVPPSSFPLGSLRSEVAWCDGPVSL